MTITIGSFAEAKPLEGTHVGYSEYIEVTQDRVDQFAAVTGDEQWIHVDVARARRESPFGQTIAHGYLTLSLGPRLFSGLISPSGFSSGVNYGCNRVRFVAPLMVGARLRLGAEIQSVKEIPDGCEVEARFTFEAAGSERPICVADNVFRYFD